MTTAIDFIDAREILDSRGNPTVEVDVVLDDGSVGRAAVPSGASTGAHEAVELRDGDKSRFGGKGVLTAVTNVTDIIGAVAARARRVGPGRHRRGPHRHRRDDQQGRARGERHPRRVARLRPRAPRRRTTCRSTATSAASAPGPCPVPMFNILNGGKHAQDSTDFQEFMVMPVGLETYSEALRAGAEIFGALRTILHDEGHATGQGDEGGFAPSLPSNEAAVEVILRADREGRLPARRGRVDRPRSGDDRTRRTGHRRGRRHDPLRPCPRRPDAGLRGAGRPVGRLGRALSDRLDRGRPGRGRLDRLAAPRRAARRARSSSSATTCS